MLRYDKCECENNCQVIDISRVLQRGDIISGTIHPALPLSGPLNKYNSETPKFCPLCGVRTFYLYKRITCPAVPENTSFYYSDCAECQLIINRMFEYWQNRHPLLLTLSGNDYLKSDRREAIIAAKCEETRKKLYNEIFALSQLFPKDLCQEIINNRLKIIYSEYRLSAEDLSAN